MSNTGYNSLFNDANTDLITLYDSQNKSNIVGSVTTEYKVNVSGYNNTDLGSVFTLYSNLTTAGYTGMQGLPCGYKDPTDTDIGTLFCIFGTVSSSVPMPTGSLSSIPSGCQGLFACKWVNSNYTGPIIQLRRSSDNANSNFYMNKTGTIITTGQYGTGTSLATWLGASVAYVIQWYDQSTVGNHAMQTTTTLQPSYNTTGNYLNFSTNNNSKLVLPSSNSNTTGSTLSKATGGALTGTSAFTLITKHFNSGVTVPYTNEFNGSFGVFFSAGTNVDIDAFMMRNESGGNSSYSLWLNHKPNLKIGYNRNQNDIITCKYDGTNIIYGYINGGVGGSSGVPGTPSGVGSNYGTRNTNNVNVVIGTGLASWAQYTFKGQLYHMSLFNVALSDADRNKMEFI